MQPLLPQRVGQGSDIGLVFECGIRWVGGAPRSGGIPFAVTVDAVDALGLAVEGFYVGR
jgi:hypothetical protein